MYPRHTPIVLVALEKAKTFNELEKETKIPPSTLSRSLKILVKNELIKARPLTPGEEAQSGGMWKYEMTSKGKNVLPTAKKSIEMLHEFWDQLSTGN